LEFFSFSHGLSLQVKTTAQLDAALSFLATTGSENLDLNKFEEACGVGMIHRTLVSYIKLIQLLWVGKSVFNFMHICTGVEVSREDISRAVNEVFEENKASILELRYRTNGICSISPSNGFS
jgi:glutaminyl-tRNA synthetase